MPLVAQITGAVALTALVMGPWWAAVPGPDPLPATVPVPQPVAAKAGVAQHAPVLRHGPAQLSLDVRHAFASLDLSVTIDGQSVLETTLIGSGRRFKVFGKRSERRHRRTVNLAPGAHVVSVRVRSAPDKVDETRVERLDLESAALASVRISVDKSGLRLVAERPLNPPPAAAAPPPPAPQKAAAAVTVLPPAPSPPRARTLAATLQSIRSILIWIAGFVASTASAFVFEEWLRTRRNLMFPEGDASNTPPRRRRAGFAG